MKNSKKNIIEFIEKFLKTIMYYLAMYWFITNRYEIAMFVLLWLIYLKE